MPITAVTSRYANALADVVTASGAALDPDAVAESAELRNALLTPAVAPGRKKAVVERIGAMLGISRIVRNLLFVLVDHRRIAMLPDLATDFEAVMDERLGFARAEVAAASELTAAQRTAVAAELERVTGKRIRADRVHDLRRVGTRPVGCHRTQPERRRGIVRKIYGSYSSGRD
jgi:F-type H+-transporting ATPase subunit delta